MEYLCGKDSGMYQKKKDFYMVLSQKLTKKQFLTFQTESNSLIAQLRIGYAKLNDYLHKKEYLKLVSIAVGK